MLRGLFDQGYKGNCDIFENSKQTQSISRYLSTLTETMASLQIISLITAATSVVALAGTPNVYASGHRSACYDDTAADNTCCYLSPARLLQTQVWDTRPVTGPLGKRTL